MSTRQQDMSINDSMVSYDESDPLLSNSRRLTADEIKNVSKEVEDISKQMSRTELEDYKKTIQELLDKTNEQLPKAKIAYEAALARVQIMIQWDDERKKWDVEQRKCHDERKEFLVEHPLEKLLDECSLEELLVKYPLEEILAKYPLEEGLLEECCSRQLCLPAACDDELTAVLRTAPPRIEGLQHIPIRSTCDRHGLYDAVASCLGVKVEELRERIIKYVEDNIDNTDNLEIKIILRATLNLEKYIRSLKEGKELSTELEVMLLSTILERSLVIVDRYGYISKDYRLVDNKDPIFVCNNGYHYEAYRVQKGYKASSVLLKLLIKRFPAEVLGEVEAILCHGNTPVSLGIDEKDSLQPEGLSPSAILFSQQAVMVTTIRGSALASDDNCDQEIHRTMNYKS